jgi:DNA-binding transcriptional MerR regulator
MNSEEDPNDQASRELELFQPRPDVFYSIDLAAELAGVSRRALLMYCRAGLVRPAYQPPYGVMEFNDEAILLVRRLERMRVVHGLGVGGLQAMAGLLEEVEHLRAELRFWRGF